jgi:hypothetical protein
MEMEMENFEGGKKKKKKKEEILNLCHTTQLQDCSTNKVHKTLK